MKPTIEILENISRNSSKNKDEIFTRLYRYLLRPDLYYAAYQNLYSNKGAATKGVDNDQHNQIVIGRQILPKTRKTNIHRKEK